MADPRMLSVVTRAQRDHLSPLMRAKAASLLGQVVNACPFGCEDERLDRHGYCKHLVGFTSDVGPKDKPLPGATYEPRVVQPGPHPDDERQSVDGVGRRPVSRDDVLVRISTSYRVYRDVDGKGRTPSPIDSPPEETPLTREDVRSMLREELRKALEDLTSPRPAAVAEEAA